MDKARQDYQKALDAFYARETLYDKEALNKTLAEYKDGVFRDIAADAIRRYCEHANKHPEYTMIKHDAATHSNCPSVFSSQNTLYRGDDTNLAEDGIIPPKTSGEKK